MTLVNEGMGGFLNPPNHPEHNWSIRDWNNSLSLSYALKCEYVDEYCKQSVRHLLSEWEKNKLPLNHPDIVKWVRGVLTYFHTCYSGQDTAGNVSWNASDLRIMPDADPMLNADIHAGVHFIRNYYPEFVPTKEDFETPTLWGKA